jgi:hypothetical protein
MNEDDGTQVVTKKRCRKLNEKRFSRYFTTGNAVIFQGLLAYDCHNASKTWTALIISLYKRPLNLFLQNLYTVEDSYSEKTCIVPTGSCTFSSKASEMRCVIWQDICIAL